MVEKSDNGVLSESFAPNANLDPRERIRLAQIRAQTEQQRRLIQEIIMEGERLKQQVRSDIAAGTDKRIKEAEQQLERRRGAAPVPIPDFVYGTSRGVRLTSQDKAMIAAHAKSYALGQNASTLATQEAAIDSVVADLSDAVADHKNTERMQGKAKADFGAETAEDAKVLKRSERLAQMEGTAEAITQRRRGDTEGLTRSERLELLRENARDITHRRDRGMGD